MLMSCGKRLRDAAVSSDHVVALRITRKSDADHDRLGWTIRKAEPGREEILLHLDGAHLLVRTGSPADLHQVGVEVEHLEAAIDAYGEGIVFPANADRCGHLAVQLPLIADIQTMSPAADRGRKRGICRIRIQQRRHGLRRSRKRQAEQKVPKLIEEIG